MSEKIKYTDALADYVLTNGISEASLRPMAKAAGTSDRMLVYHYGSKAGVMEAALSEIARRNIATLEAILPPDPMPARDLMALLGSIAISDQFNPVFAVFFELAALSRRGDETALEVGHKVISHFKTWIEARITEPERAGELLASVEGWGVVTSFGLDVPFPSG